MKTFFFKIALLAAFCSAILASEIRAQGQMSAEVPAFSYKTINGKSLNIKDLKGKVVLISFWTTWCQYCEKAMPRIEKEIWQKYKDNKNFVLITISPEENEKDLIKHAAKVGYTFPMVADPKKEIQKVFPWTGLPAHFIIDAEGNFSFARIGFSDKGIELLKNALREELEAVEKK